MKKKPAIAIALLLAAGLLAGVYFATRPGKSTQILRVSGNIEVVDVALSFQVGGQIATRPVDEGSSVKVGELVAALDSRELQAELTARRADAAAAAANLAELEAGTRQEEIDQAQAAMEKAQWALEAAKTGSRPEEKAAAKAATEQAKADVERLKVDLEKTRKLFEAGVSGEEEYNDAYYSLQGAVARHEQAQAQQKLTDIGPRKEDIEQAQRAYDQAKAACEQAKNGPRKEDIEAARAKLAQAQATARQAEVRMTYAELKCPLEGMVLSKNLEPGEYATPGTPVVTVADTRKVFLRAYVDEPDLPRVKLGQSVRVTVDAYPGKVYRGVVSFIADQAEFTPKNVQTEKERVKLVFRVKIDIDNPDSELKPGMPADAEIVLTK